MLCNFHFVRSVWEALQELTTSRFAMETQDSCYANIFLEKFVIQILFQRRFVSTHIYFAMNIVSYNSFYMQMYLTIFFLQKTFSRFNHNHYFLYYINIYWKCADLLISFTYIHIQKLWHSNLKFGNFILV